MQSHTSFIVQVICNSLPSEHEFVNPLSGWTPIIEHYDGVL